MKSRSKRTKENKNLIILTDQEVETLFFDYDVKNDVKKHLLQMQ